MVIEAVVMVLLCAAGNVIAVKLSEYFEESQRAAIYFVFALYFIGGVFYVNLRGQQGYQSRRLDKIEAVLELSEMGAE